MNKQYKGKTSGQTSAGTFQVAHVDLNMTGTASNTTMVVKGVDVTTCDRLRNILAYCKGYGRDVVRSADCLQTKLSTRGFDGDANEACEPPATYTLEHLVRDLEEIVLGQVNSIGRALDECHRALGDPDVEERKERA